MKHKLHYMQKKIYVYAIHDGEKYVIEARSSEDRVLPPESRPRDVAGSTRSSREAEAFTAVYAEELGKRGYEAYDHGIVQPEFLSNVMLFPTLLRSSGAARIEPVCPARRRES